MNKRLLVASVAEQTELDRRSVKSVIDAAMETIASVMERKKRVMLIGFGTFGVAKRRARIVNHPQTKEPLKIEAKTVPVFRPGTRLKKRIAARRGRGRPRKR